MMKQQTNNKNNNEDKNIHKTSPYDILKYMLQILVWLVYCSIYYSMWVLVVHCCVRTRTVYQPNLVETRRKQTELRVNLGLISVLLLILNSHFLYGFSDLVFNR